MNKERASAWPSHRTLHEWRRTRSAPRSTVGRQWPDLLVRGERSRADPVRPDVLAVGRWGSPGSDFRQENHRLLGDQREVRHGRQCRWDVLPEARLVWHHRHALELRQHAHRMEGEARRV